MKLMDDNEFLESYLSILEEIEGKEGGDTTTDIPTGYLGIVNTLGIDPADYPNNPRGLAKAVAEKNIQELKRIGVNWDELPLSMKYNALDMQFNFGSLNVKAQNYLENLKAGNYAGAINETLDALSASDPRDGKQRPVKGIALRRAKFYNLVASDIGVPTITSVDAVNQDNAQKSAKFTYGLDDGNTIVKPFTVMSLHSRSVPGLEKVLGFEEEVDVKPTGEPLPTSDLEERGIAEQTKSAFPTTGDEQYLDQEGPIRDTGTLVEPEESRGILDRIKDFISPDTDEEKRLKEIRAEEPETLDLPEELSEARDFSVLRKMYQEKKFNEGGLSLSEQMDTMQDPAVKQAKRRAKEPTTDKTDLEKLKDVAKFGAEFIPGVGEAMAVKRVSDAIDEKDYVGAGIETAAGALGLIPVVGDMAGKALRTATKTLRKDAKLKVDNPGYDPIYEKTYSEIKQEIADEAKDRALKRGQTDTYESNIGTSDGVTGSANQVKFKPEELKDIPGTMGEEKFRSSGEKLQRLKKSIKEEGYKEDPIMIHVREDGQPFIVEGNHRLAEALESGRDSITADIRYLRGAEEKEGLLDPKNIFPNNLTKQTDEVFSPPLEIGVNEYNVKNLDNPQLIKNYTFDDYNEVMMASNAGSTAGSKAKNKKINVPVSDGTEVAVRLNLSSKIDPSGPEAPFNRMQTIHPVRPKSKKPDYSKSTSYMNSVTVENGVFDVDQKLRRNIAETGQKVPAAGVQGKITSTRNVLEEGGDDIVEISMNPKQQHLFTDVSTGQAVKSFDVATVLRDRVYAKGVKYWKKSEAPEPLPSTNNIPINNEVRYKFKQGGAVPMKEQMSMFDDGGLMDEGNTIDPISGNDVPPGSTQEEVRDDIPAQLSEGEFVFPADVVRYIGLEKLMQMRQQAKMGLQTMDDMGQMGNSEEAIMPDNLPFELTDLDMDDDPVEMNTGGVAGVSTVPSQVPATSFVQAPPPATTMPIPPTPTPTPAPVPIASTYTPPTQQAVPTFTPEQMKDVTYPGVLQTPEAAPKLIDIINPTTGEKRSITYIPGVTEIPEGFVLASEYDAPDAQATSVTPTVGQTSVRKDDDDGPSDKTKADMQRYKDADFYRDMLGLTDAKPFSDILGDDVPGTITATGYIIGDNGERIDPITLEPVFFGKEGIKYALNPDDKPPLNIDLEGGINRKIKSLKDFRDESSRLKRENQTKEAFDEYNKSVDFKDIKKDIDAQKALKDKKEADTKKLQQELSKKTEDKFKQTIAKEKKEKKDKPKKAPGVGSIKREKQSAQNFKDYFGLNEGGLASRPKPKPKQMRSGGLASKN